MHPESLGNREVNPHIKTDYGESQPEIITPPLAPYSRAHDWLQTLSYVLMANLPEDEYMWPFSVPCQLPEDDRLINISQTSNPELEEYRLRSEEHTSELQSRGHLVCRLLLEKKKKNIMSSNKIM